MTGIGRGCGETHEWTAEMEAFVEEAYGKTAKSSSEIASDLNKKFGTNFSRNAVIGKINRLGLREKYKEQHGVRAGNKSAGNQYWKKPLTKCVKSIEEVKSEPVARSKAKPVSPLTIQNRINVGDKRTEPNFERQGALDKSEPIGILELNDHRCRWPLGAFADKPPYLYCGCQVAAGLPYCAPHVRQSKDHSAVAMRRKGAASALPVRRY